MRNWIWVLLCAALALLCAAACLCGNPASTAMELLCLPFAQGGTWLRRLSLAGAAGNGAAVGIWALLSLLPLAGLWALRRRLHAEDALLVLLTPLLGLSWWCAVNPGRLSVWIPEMELAYLSGAVWMTLLCWGLLRLLRACFAGRVAWAVGLLLRLLALGLTAAVFGGCFGELVSGWRALLASNTGGHALSQAFLAAQCLISALPYALELWLLPLAETLRLAAAADSHSAAAVAAAERLAGRCRAALTASLLAQTGFDLLQLLCMPWLRVSRMQLFLPLDAVLFVLLVLVLARQFAAGRRLQEDNDSFI